MISLEILTETKIISRLEAERKKPFKRIFIDMLMDAFSSYHVQELGGTVRDAVIYEWYGTPLSRDNPYCIHPSLSDWDLIIDDSKQEVNLFDICSCLPGEIGENFFGDVK